ncbi:MAG TPA: two-component sensor histidine kinase [Planctomycetaceae bacterium]|nr:two-component sensor histidine kinase [Planctomycetaceae bacterium]
MLAKNEELLGKLEFLQVQLRTAQKLATIGELASTTTHEFNNLLMTVVNYARLGMRHKDEATRDKAFARINDAASRATKVAGSVLSLARNKAAKHEPIELANVVANAQLLLEREFRKYRVQLDVNVEAVPKVVGDSNELQRVLINFLVNARQATPEGGYVKIGLAADSATSEVVLTIRDSGTGIEPSVLPRIFDPFFSTKSGPDESGKGGTGVGLSACKEAIDAHGGRIRVESAIGKGTAFIIRLPSVDAA